MKKRFIAGVKCPRCNAIDRIVMLTDFYGKEHIECIECDYKDERPTFTRSAQPTLKTMDITDDVGVIQFKPKQH